MAFISPVIVPAKKLVDGSHKIRIALSHNGETRYFVTNIKIDSVKQFKNGQVVGRSDARLMNAKIRNEMDKLQSSLDGLEYIEGFTCSELVRLIKESERIEYSTIKDTFEAYCRLSSAKPSTIRAYGIIYRSLATFFGEGKAIRTLTHTDVLAFDRHLRSRRMTCNTIHSYMTFFFTLYNFAKKVGTVNIASDIIRGYRKPRMEVRDSWIGMEGIRAVRDFTSRTKGTMKARDFFMLSYYLGGINMEDLKHIDFNKCQKELRYTRTKTEFRGGQETRFTIPEEAKPIIAKYIMKDGHLDIGKDSKVNYNMSYGMRRIRKALGIPNLYMYSARKTFSQNAFELGVSTRVIDYVLGHSLRNSGILYHYVSVSKEMADSAIRKVIEYTNADLKKQETPNN